MYLAKAVGTVVSTNRNPQLTGMKLLVIRRLSPEKELVGEMEVAADAVGAGVGDTVVVASGGSARVAFPDRATPIDSSIIEIVDILEVQHG